jgi:hypothetical protein
MKLPDYLSTRDKLLYFLKRFFLFLEGGQVDVAGKIVPKVDDTYDLGSSSRKWANIYTGDLHLANDRGNWTVVEEEDSLTIRNNKTGKRFKLLMEEIED